MFDALSGTLNPFPTIQNSLKKQNQLIKTLY